MGSAQRGSLEGSARLVSTCWRRLAEWEETGVFVDMWHEFINELDEQGRIDWNEIFMDGSFAPAKKGPRRG